MVVNTHTIGTLVSVRRIEIDGFENGEWKTEMPRIELQVSSEGLDNDGELNFSLDKVTLDSKLYSKFKEKQGQVIAIPYKMETTKKGQKFEYDESMPILNMKDKLTNLIVVDKAK